MGHENYLVLEQIKKEVGEYISFRIDSLTLQERQIVCIEFVRVMDLLFVERYVYDTEPNYKEKVKNVITYGYPTFVKHIYENFKGQKSVPLIASDENSIYNSKCLVNSSEIYGITRDYEERLQLRLMKVKKNKRNFLSLTFSDKYHWIEHIERENILEYAHIIIANQKNNYIEAYKKLPKIIHQMEPLVYKWRDHFIGYDTNPTIDEFFYNNALLDAMQAVEWYSFPKDCMFGGIPFEKYVHTVVMLMASSIKHIQFAQLLNEKEPQLKVYNLLTIIKVESEMIETIAYINDISINQAKIIYKTLVLNQENKVQHSKVWSAAPPLLQISNHQVIKSICGCLDRPFEFMLDELRQQFPREWDANTKLREEQFRNELYSYFENDRYHKINRGIVIKENGKIITDIDGCIIDKITGDIAFIQLKWQDLAYDSNKSVFSKAKNFNEKTSGWVQAVRAWIDTVTEKKIADSLGINMKYIKKDKIKLFVIGRFNGNYSGDEILDRDVAWGQWYQIIHIMMQLNDKDSNIIELYEKLRRKNPFNIKVKMVPTVYKYGKLKIKVE